MIRGRAWEHRTYPLCAAGIQRLAPSTHHERIIDADHEDLASVLEVRVGEIARNVLLGAPRACAAPSVYVSNNTADETRDEHTEGSRNANYDAILGSKFLG